MSTCPNCGKEFFSSKHPNQEFCNRECWLASKHETRLCVCGKEYYCKKTANKKYCSATCGFKNRPRPQKDNDKRAVFECKVCGKSFEEWVYRNPSCCSRKCASTLSNGVPKPTLQKPEIHITLCCVICGKDYQTNTHHVRLRGSSCCSRECAYKHISNIKRGENNVNWRGGTIKGRGENWNSQRRKAFIRDGGKCQICKKKISRVKHDYGIHHIIPYREFDGDFEKANELSNLVTLCRRCHAKVEFGRLPCPKPLI